MTYTRQVTIWCDRCGNWEQASVTARTLRKRLARNGWRHAHGKDYCAACVDITRERPPGPDPGPDGNSG